MLFAITNGSLLLIVLGIVAIIAFATVVLRRRREHVWSGFARELGLKYSVREGQPSVTGDVDGRALALFIVADSSDTGPLGVEVVRMTLTLLRSVPGGLMLESADDLIGEAQRLVDARQVKTGDGKFDHSVFAQASNEDAARAWLTTERRAAIRKLIRDRVSGDVRLQGSELQWTCRDSFSNTQALAQQLTLLRRAAEVLDAE